MAWRIHDSVVRGELDSRTRGVVRGSLWLHGETAPIRLELEGNPCADLAGCHLRFRNPGLTAPLRPGGRLAPVQQGGVGDMTASRKVRVFDVPMEEAMELLKSGITPSEHLANCLYLEWFSTANGRVVVESAEYELTLSAHEWHLSPGDERERQRTTARGWESFLRTLTDAVEREHGKLPDRKDTGSWDEFDCEQFLRESDARTEKLMALLDRYEGHPDAERIIASEMGWNASDAGAELTGSIQRMDPAACEHPDPATEGVDWVRDENGTAVHPVYLRCQQLGRSTRDAVDRSRPEARSAPDVTDLICQLHLTGARLSGALNPLAYGRHRCGPPFIVASLKRSLRHLEAAGEAAERMAARDDGFLDVVRMVRTELGDLRESVVALVEEFRFFRGGITPGDSRGGQ